MNRRFFPVLLLALLLIGAGWGYLIFGETPRGQITGSAVLLDAQNKPLEDCDIYLSPAAEADEDESDALPKTEAAKAPDVRESRHVKTNKNGQFALRSVPVGIYNVSASAKWHEAEGVKVTVSEGQNARAVLSLKRSQPDLSVGDHQAVFAASEAPFLPVRGYAALPTGNKSDANNLLHVKLWRTRLGDVLKRSDAASDLNALQHSYDGKEATLTPALLMPKNAPAPVLVSDKQLPIEGTDREGFFASHFPLEAASAKPGLYLVKFAYRNYSASSYVLVTNLALVVKKSPDKKIVVFAADLISGAPVANARVSLLRGGAVFGTTQTGANGVAHLTAPAKAASDNPENETANLLTAVVGEDEAVVSDSGYYGGNDSKNYVVQGLTDRTVYRPGDTVSYKCVVRQRKNSNGDGNGQAYSVPANLPALIEMRDESGGLVARQSKTTNASGAVWGTMDISREGGTGTYSLTTTVGGEAHDSQVVVAAYRKPEFSVTITPEKPRTIRGEMVRMKIKATYYFGGPVAGGDVRYYLYRDADWQSEYASEDGDETSDYGDNPASYRAKSYAAYFGEGMGDGTVKLDENGEATVSVRTDVRHIKQDGETNEEAAEAEKKAQSEPVPQVESYKLTAEVQDASKRSVEADGEALVAAGNITVSVSPEGFVATPEKPMNVFVSVRDGQTKAVKPNAAVSLLAVYDVWDKKTRTTKAVRLSAAQTAQTGPDGRATLVVVPPRSGEIRLIATAEDDARRTVRAEGSLWAASNGGDDLNTDYGDLSLLSDKRAYLPGDTAKILVNTSRTGQSILLSVEGETVYQTQVLPSVKKSTVVYLPIKSAWGPNVTLVANYVKNKKYANFQTPLRVALPTQNLTVSVKPVSAPAQNKYLPGDKAAFAVLIKDANGKPVSSDFSLGVVDESIYALREDNPDALKQTFHPRRNNRVFTDFSFAVEYLGDVSKAEPKIKARTKFKDTAFWLPDGHTNANGAATISLTLPDNLTTWRTTVQAVSDTTSVGYARTQILSAKPFFVRLETPRYLVGGDKSAITALVHNDTGASQTVRVKLSASALQVAGADTQTLSVASGAVGAATWQVTPPQTGTFDRAGLRLTAWTGEQNNRNKSFTDGIETTLPLRAFGRAEFAPFASVMDGAKSEQTLLLSSDAMPDETRLTLRVTPSVRGTLAGGVNYLVGFPYGCTEQTLSRFTPDLLAERYDLLSGVAASQKPELPRMVRDGVTRLARMQHYSGAWGWWETDTDDPFMTAYALCGLSEAQASGYEINADVLNRGREAAAKMAQTAPSRFRPFLLYALHKAGYEDKTNLLRAPFIYGPTRTHLVPAKLPVDALAYLVLLGRELNADVSPFYAELEKRGTREGALLRFTPYPKPPKGYDPSCSDRMASALALRVFLVVNKNDARIPALIRYLMLSRTSEYFGDTRDTAWVLTAFCDYLRAFPEPAGGANAAQIEVLLNNQSVAAIQPNDTRTENGEIVLSLPTRNLHAGKNTLTLARGGNGSAVFYTGALSQTVSAPKNGDLPPIKNNVSITREIVRVLPKKSTDGWSLQTEPLGNGAAMQGDRLRIRLTVTAERDAAYVLIEDTFPSGAEVTERGTADEDVDSSSGTRGAYFYPDHVDVKDDHIAFFAKKLPQGKHVLEYNLRAQTPGTSRALPASVQAMYDGFFRGQSGTTALEVKK